MISWNNSQGSALIVSMVLLIILTVLGLSGVQTSTLEVRMASNMVDRAKAFQAAEHTLKYAQKKLLEMVENNEYKTKFGTTPGLYKTLNDSGDSSQKTCNTSTPWMSQQAKWDDVDSIQIPDGKAQDLKSLHLKKLPRFMIGHDNELNSKSLCYSKVNPDGYSNSIGSQGEPLKIERFTITVIGYGSKPNTRVRLQATYNALK